MSSLKPVIHGRDHEPGGADPIPAIKDIIADAYAPNPSSAVYHADETVASLDAVTADWTYLSGDAGLLDLTTPSAPIPTMRGVYTVTTTITSPDATWTPGSNLVGKLFANGPVFNLQQEASATFDTTADPAHTRAFVSLTVLMGGSPNDFLLQLENEDSISHVLIADWISVTRILAY